MRKLALGVIVLSFAVACAGPAFAVQNWIIQEVTFDDADSNANPIKSLEMRVADPDQFWYMNFVGTATRTNTSGGKYGRGAQFDGDVNSRIEITRLNHPGVDDEVPNDDFRLLLWIKPTLQNQERQEIFRAVGSFAVELKNGEIKIRDEDSDPHVHSTGKTLSVNAFHHLWIEYDGAQMTVSVDFDTTNPAQVDFGPMEDWDEDTEGSMGNGFWGVLDELLVTRIGVYPGEVADLEFDRNPANCPSGLSCAESSSIIVSLPNWSVDLPVRYKAVWKAATCSDTQPCPLLFSISGGGACADDYSPVYEVEAYAERRFLVVTVDPACEKGYPWLKGGVEGHETSQLIAAKDHVRDPENPLSDLILGTDYYATGCSHGAQSVASWLLSEVDHPKRGFARSANYAGHCTYHMAPFVGNWNKMDQVLCGDFDDPSPHDDSQTQPKLCIEDQVGVINKVNVTSVQERELGAIWGAPKFEYESCCTRKGCTDSLEGNELSGRLMRDYWRSKEQGSPTGWFWEWGRAEDNTTCTHCPWDYDHPYGGDVGRCSACFLRYGYTEMNNVFGCEDCDNMNPGGPPSDQCPEVWGVPGGGLDLPCGPLPSDPPPFCTEE